MTQRERSLLLVVCTIGGFLLLFGGFILVRGLFEGLEAKDRQIESLERDLSTNQMKLAILGRNRKTVERWRAISLPPDLTMANSRYRAFMQDLSRRHDLVVRQVSDGNTQRVNTGRNQALVTPLTYNVHLEGTLAHFIGFLQEFYELNLPHLIRDVTILPLGAGADARLDIAMKIEALSMPTAANRDYLTAVPESSVLALDIIAGLKRVPVGLGIGPWLMSPQGLHGPTRLASDKNESRAYARMVSKNAFAGLAPATPPQAIGDRSVLRFVQLTSTYSNFLATEATFRNRLTNHFHTVRVEPVRDELEIRDGEGNLILKGKVKAINPKNVVLAVGEKHYLVEIGQFLSQALEHVLSPEELKQLGVEMAAVPTESP